MTSNVLQQADESTLQNHFMPGMGITINERWSSFFRSWARVWRQHAKRKLWNKNEF